MYLVFYTSVITALCVTSKRLQVGRSGGAGAGRGRSGGVLQLAEASTCLSLVAGLAAQLGSGTARGRLWQQVHTHMLPLLERCLGELARGVTAPTPAPGAGKGKAAEAAEAAEAAAQGQGQGQGPSTEDVAAIVLVCQVSGGRMPAGQHCCPWLAYLCLC